MKTLRILATVFTFFIIPICFAQQPKNDWEKENLKGRVKTLKEMRTYDTDTTRKRWLNTPILHIFNAAGNFVLSKRLTLVENSVDSTVYFYDSANRLSRQLTYGKKRQLRDSISYTYFNDGSKVVYFQLFMYSPTVETTLHTYDSKGNLIHRVSRHIDTTITKGNDDVAIVNQYNKKGWLIKTIESRKGGVVFNVTTYKYDKHGNKVENKVFLPKKLWSIDRYNDKGSCIEFILYDNDEVIRYQAKMTYNEWGDQIGQTGSNRNGKPIAPYKVEYEYDSQHNWTKETWYNGNEIKSVRVRTIEYL